MVGRGALRVLAGFAALVLVAGCGSSVTEVAPTPSQPAAPSVEAVSVDAATAPEFPPAAEQPVRRKVVVLDPGHGGDEIGAARNGVVEKDSNLDFALRVENLLLDRGVDVVLTRRADARAAAQVPGYTAARSDIQARLDLANDVGADVFVSLHSNGSEDTSQKGVETWYDSSRPFAEDNLRLARLLLSHVLGEVRAYGYPARDRGIFDGKCYRVREGRCFTLFVLGGPRETSRDEVVRRGGNPDALGFSGPEPIYSRPADMPAALIELLIITNAEDAAVLRRETARDVMARGVAEAILEYLGLDGQ